MTDVPRLEDCVFYHSFDLPGHGRIEGTVDNNSWIFSSQTNAHLDSARGGSNASYAVFAFPRSYFSRTRSIVFVSTTDEVYGADLVANLSGN